MTLRRTAITLRVEREVDGPGGLRERLALEATLEGGEGAGGEGGVEELRSALARLRAEMDALAPSASGGPRSLDELVETYRPRQRELVALLEADGEITGPEANLLLAHLAQGGGDGSAGSGLPPPTDRPIAALPLENDRTPSTPRPISRLLSEYRIETLKQAGAVRARRQISYEEYMALKRHFSAQEAVAGGSGAASAPGTGG